MGETLILQKKDPTERGVFFTPWVLGVLLLQAPALASLYTGRYESSEITPLRTA